MSLNSMIEGYCSAVFDFDGVIVDSNKGKTNAFRRVLAEDPPELVERFIAYHLEHGSVSRYVKLEHYYRNMLKRKDYEVATAKTVQMFGTLSSQILMNAEEIPGISNLLKILHDRRVSCFIVTGGKKEEVCNVVKARGWDLYFSRVLGSPATKIENLQLLEDAKLLVKPGVYYGDTKADFEAALAFDLSFVFVSGFSEWNDGRRICQEKSLAIIRDFYDLL